MLLLSSLDLFQNQLFKKSLIRVSNGLNPDQNRQKVCPDLGPSCLQRLPAYMYCGYSLIGGSINWLLSMNATYVTNIMKKQSVDELINIAPNLLMCYQGEQSLLNLIYDVQYSVNKWYNIIQFVPFQNNPKNLDLE